MKKFEIIRDIFSIVMRCGFNDDKQDAISEYTKDKLTNPVYVKKLKTTGLSNIDSIAITALESDFSDACDSDLRIAFNDTNIGKRIILYANEVESSILISIRAYLMKEFGLTKDENMWINAMNYMQINPTDYQNVEIPRKVLDYILTRFKEEIIDK